MHLLCIYIKYRQYFINIIIYIVQRRPLIAFMIRLQMPMPSILCYNLSILRLLTDRPKTGQKRNAGYYEPLSFTLFYYTSSPGALHKGCSTAKYHSAQSKLSISSLEAELGVSLFEKDGRNIVLTKCGKDFLSDVEHSLSILDSGILKMQLISRDKAMIEIGFLRTLGIDYIPLTLSSYLRTEEGENAAFHFHDGITADLIPMLKDRTCDVVFCSYAKDKPGVEFFPIAAQDLVLIVPLDHPLADRTEADLSETLPYPQIFHPRSGLRSIVDNLFQKINATPNIALEIEEDQVIAGFVAAGFGIAIVPDMFVLNQLSVKKISIKNPSWERRFYMAYLKNQYQTPVLWRFIQFIKENKEKTAGDI